MASYNRARILKLREEYLRKGIPVPTREMIKSEAEIEGIRKAGEINTKVLDEVATRIAECFTTEDINTIVHETTIKLGGIPAPLNYNGYPKSCCTSVNDVVCHGIPSTREVLKDGDIVNVDVTTIYNGYFADASRMFVIGKCSDNAKYMLDVLDEAFAEIYEFLKPGVRLGDLGFLIDSICKKRKVSVVHGIGGHGIGKNFHEDPYVAHHGKKNTGIVILPGMTFTIEPMINQGKKDLIMNQGDDWTVYTRDGSLSVQKEHTFLITEEGFEILTK